MGRLGMLMKGEMRMEQVCQNEKPDCVNENELRLFHYLQGRSLDYAFLLLPFSYPNKWVGFRPFSQANMRRRSVQQCNVQCPGRCTMIHRIVSSQIFSLSFSLPSALHTITSCALFALPHHLRLYPSPSLPPLSPLT
jgi:hypothetical protein